MKSKRKPTFFVILNGKYKSIIAGSLDEARKLCKQYDISKKRIKPEFGFLYEFQYDV